MLDVPILSDSQIQKNEELDQYFQHIEQEPHLLYIKFFLDFNVTMSHTLIVSELWCDIVTSNCEISVFRHQKTNKKWHKVYTKMSAHKRNAFSSYSRTGRNMPTYGAFCSKNCRRIVIIGLPHSYYQTAA